MSESTLQRFDRNGIELILDTTTGESFTTIFGYALMGQKAESTISFRLEVMQAGCIQKAAIMTPGGFKGFTLIPGKIALRWLVQDNPALLADIAECGWIAYCHKLAGYKVTPIASQHEIPKIYAAALLEAGRLAAENEELLAQNKQFSRQIQENASKVALAESILIGKP